MTLDPIYQDCCIVGTETENFMRNFLATEGVALKLLYSASSLPPFPLKYLQSRDRLLFQVLLNLLKLSLTTVFLYSFSFLRFINYLWRI